MRVAFCGQIRTFDAPIDTLGPGLSNAIRIKIIERVKFKVKKQHKMHWLKSYSSVLSSEIFTGNFLSFSVFLRLYLFELDRKDLK